LILRHLFARKPKPAAVLYDAIVAAARQPIFYEKWGVPDTLDGRFDVIVLHMFLVLERLKGGAEETRANLIDYFFLDMDRSLREMGVGDVSVGKKVRKMAEAFYGRLTAYSDAVGKSEEALITSLTRNLYAGQEAEHVADVAAWVAAARRLLAAQMPESILGGDVKFT
jgi:cytochrome b pre-mRNA-processing protein 3